MIDAMDARRSIRKFCATPIPRQDLIEILRSGMKAPSPKNRQPWKYVVVEGDAKAEMLRVFRAGIAREQAEGALLPQSKKHIAAANYTVDIMAEAPVVVDGNRFEGAELAVQNGADIIIMDDGFQNPTLYKDKSFLVIDGAAGMGNLWPVPAGPMREFLHQGLHRADAVIMLGEDKHNLLPRLGGLPVFRGDVVPVRPVCDKPHAIAFAGIGRPQKLYQSLEDCGITLVKTKDFPDHHFYNRSELESLIKEAGKLNAALFTTSKDMVKIPADLRPNFRVLEITVKWQDEEALRRFLLR